MQSGPSRRGILDRLSSILAALSASRGFPLAVALIAVVLSLPSLGAGFILDDFYHREVLRADSSSRDLLGPPSEMFRFFRGDPVRTGRLMDLGAFPWWTDPTVKGEFLQAVTVLTHRLDYWLWPDSPALMHAQNLFWLGAAVAAAALFYRRMFGLSQLAAIAALLFAVDDARAVTVGFIANRNVLVAATFGFLALGCHDRWRRAGSPGWALLGVILLGLALFSKEEGIGTCAYLAAYALFLDPRGVRRGCLAMAPYVVMVVAWRALRDSWGYGVHNLGLYIDPLSDPGPFAAAFFERLPWILLGQWTPFPPEIAVMLGKPISTIAWWSALAFIAVLIFAFVPLLKRDRLARFWAAGTLFASIHVCATLPMDRLLTFAGLGAFGLLAQFWSFVSNDSAGAPRSRGWRLTARALAWLFFLFHAVWAPLASPFRSTSPIGIKWVENRLYVRTPLGPDIAQKTLVVVNAPSAAHAAYVTFRELAHDRPMPRYTRVLAPAVPGVRIRRLNDRTLEITPGWGYLQLALDQVFRCDRRPLALGEEVKLTGMIARVTALDGRRTPRHGHVRVRGTARVNVIRVALFPWQCFRAIHASRDRPGSRDPFRLAGRLQTPGLLTRITTAQAKEQGRGSPGKSKSSL